MTTSRQGATMADWLALHGLTPAICHRILELGPGIARAASQDHTAPASSSPDEVWQACGQAVLSRMPEAGRAVEDMMARTRVSFSPDQKRYPRAFTLHDDGHGRPFVSIPWRGERGDILVAAHEFGHALQIVASAGRDAPPVLRETCAILSEAVLASDADGLPSQDGQALSDLFRTTQRQSFARHVPALRAAVDNPGAQYDYDWNYPLASSLASGLASRGSAVWPVFEMRLTMIDLMESLGI